MRKGHPRERGTSPPGTVLEVCGVAPTRLEGLAGPALRPVGLAMVNHDQTITAWLDAMPIGGTLLLRPCPREALLQLDPAVPTQGLLATTSALGEA